MSRNKFGLKNPQIYSSSSIIDDRLSGDDVAADNKIKANKAVSNSSSALLYILIFVGLYLLFNK